MIKMVLEVNHPRGEPDLWCPQVFCDRCGRRIETAANGNLMWLPADVGGDESPRFTHKACCHPFEWAWAEAHDGRWPWLAAELAALPAQLAANLRLSPGRSLAAARAADL